jgi:hypothetical protein
MWSVFFIRTILPYRSIRLNQMVNSSVLMLFAAWGNVK